MSQATADLSAAQENPGELAKTELFGASHAGMETGDIQRGYGVLDASHQDPFTTKEPFLRQREDDDGSTYVGDPYGRGGFLDRPIGYER